MFLGFIQFWSLFRFGIPFSSRLPAFPKIAVMPPQISLLFCHLRKKLIVPKILYLPQKNTLVIFKLTCNVQPQRCRDRDAEVVVHGLTGEDGVEVGLLEVLQPEAVGGLAVDDLKAVVQERVIPPPAQPWRGVSLKEKDSKLNSVKTAFCKSCFCYSPTQRD